VLPTGRNIHALDPYRMPSPAAMERGAAVGAAILEAHRAANSGAWPETVAVNLWGLDAIKTKVGGLLDGRADGMDGWGVAAMLCSDAGIYQLAAAAAATAARSLAPPPPHTHPPCCTHTHTSLPLPAQGESVAIALHLVGAEPVKEGTGRVARFELLPLAQLANGRPRVDVLCNMSGIFRDSFQNVVELLDDLFQRAAAADEPPELNYVRKHAGAMEAKVCSAGGLGPAGGRLPASSAAGAAPEGGGGAGAMFPRDALPCL
jgi:cobalamin biosynthesis Mg chelatase CobN